MNEAVRIPAKTGNLLFVMVTWRGKGYSLKMFFPQAKRPTRKEVELERDTELQILTTPA